MHCSQTLGSLLDNVQNTGLRQAFEAQDNWPSSWRLVRRNRRTFLNNIPLTGRFGDFLIVATRIDSADDLAPRYLIEFQLRASSIQIFTYLSNKLREENEGKRRRILLTQRLRNAEIEASKDPLCGIPNRRVFERSLRGLWNVCMKERGYISMLLVDIDWFKQVNDQFGHPKGDSVLAKVACAIKEKLCRTEDLVARLGGEEFGIILPRTDNEGALIVALEINRCIRALNIAQPNSPYGIVTVSLGVATMRPTPNDADAWTLFKEADTALYAAKSNGRNKVHQASCLPKPPQ